MKVHLVTDRFSTGGGLEHIYQVAGGIKEIDFTVFGQPDSPAAVDKLAGLPNVTVDDSGFGARRITSGNPDLIHIHHLRPLLSLYRCPLRRVGVPVLFTAHGLHLHKYEFLPGWTSGLKYRLRFQLERRLLPKPDRVIAVSREDRGFMERNYRLPNVTYLTNGIAVQDKKKHSKKHYRRLLDLPEDTLLFVTVARFNFQKGYDILLEALGRIKARLQKSNVLFVWAGDGEEFEQIKNKAQSLGLSSCIRFLGNRSDVPDILAAADVFLLPSRWEGLPIVLLEAGLHQLPVLASDTYGNREIIGSKNGILFNNLDPTDLARKITGIMDGDHRLDQLGENLHQEVNRHYNIQRMIDGLRELYRSSVPESFAIKLQKKVE
jgi:glycosyltransferase involved in cell wall biosynthesis